MFCSCSSQLVCIVGQLMSSVWGVFLPWAFWWRSLCAAALTCGAKFIRVSIARIGESGFGLLQGVRRGPGQRLDVSLHDVRVHLAWFVSTVMAGLSQVMRILKCKLGNKMFMHFKSMGVLLSASAAKLI